MPLREWVGQVSRFAPRYANRSQMDGPIDLAIVIPVYRGASTLHELISEIDAVSIGTTPSGRAYEITEVVLVWDRGSDDSPTVMRELSERYKIVRSIWLTRNFGQHGATLAGIASTGSQWIVTMDEDGQHDPALIPIFIDAAFESHARVAYLDPTNCPPHGVVRNLGSRFAKWVYSKLGDNSNATAFNSFRLIHGEVGRSVAAYTGPGVYLDVALGWVADRAILVPGEARIEGRPASSYTYRKLIGHAIRMIVTSGTKPLRVIAVLGVILAFSGFLLTLVVLYQRFANAIPVQGWTSLMIVLLLTGGSLLVAMAVIAEYLGIAVSAAMGKPLYTIGTDDARVFDDSDSHA
jgi:glycosyltransferase involved in cell wall biosynthesis